MLFMVYSFINQRPWTISLGGYSSHFPASHTLEFDLQPSSQQKDSGKRKHNFMHTIVINSESSSVRAHLGFPWILVKNINSLDWPSEFLEWSPGICICKKQPRLFRETGFRGIKQKPNQKI